MISQRTSAVNPDQVTPEQVTVAPGLPESKVFSESAGETLDVRMPGPRAEEDIDQVIVRSFRKSYNRRAAVPNLNPAAPYP